MSFQRSSLFAPALVTALSLITAGVLSACATRPPRNDQLEQARIDVRSLEQDPDSQIAAGDQLRDARTNLRRADEAFEKHGSTGEVAYLAYLADREAQTGKALTDEYRARRQLASAKEERSRILLEARTRQAQRAQQQAQAQAQAQQAEEQAEQAQEQARQAQAQAQAQAEQAAAAREAAQRAQRELQKEQQELAELKTHETQRGLELTLASDLLFNTGSAELKPGATLQINRLADFMRSNPQTRVIIEGYTDDTGTPAINEQLSEQRAQAVASVLETQGIAMDRIQTIGRGEQYPVASNGTPAGRQQNRRVDVILSNMSGRFAQGASQGPVPR